MVQKIKQANIFGRVGSGVAQGMGLQLPKEMEQYRLAQGIKNLENQTEDLTPIQQYGRYASVPGITPQMLQSFGELLKIQNRGNAVKRSAGEDVGPPMGPDSQGSPEASPNMQQPGVQNNYVLPQALPGMKAMNPLISQNFPFSKTPNVPTEAQGQPQVVPKNPLSPELMPRGPFSPKQRDARESHYIRMGFTPEEAKEKTTDDQEKWIREGKTFQETQGLLEDKEKQARNALKERLELKTQKTGEELFGDVSGPMQNNLARGMARDLRANPNLSLEDVVNDWSDRGLRLAKAQTKLKSLGARTGIEEFFRGENLETKLNSYQKVFDKAGNLEEFRNMLIKDMKMSPQGADSIAYPRSPHVKVYVDHLKPSRPITATENAQKAAIDIEARLKQNDSLLAIARDLSMRDPHFDQGAFFKQLSEDSSDPNRFTDQQLEQIAEGAKDIVPYWGDFLVFPMLERYRR